MHIGRRLKPVLLGLMVLVLASGALLAGLTVYEARQATQLREQD